MSFQYPLGLLGLIGIPILIIIYIIKSKHTEQTVSATYLWNLSNKFLKKKKKDNKITGILSLLLQILAVAIISFIIAHPVFTIRGSAHEYCFVVDTSGSMGMTTDGGKTRLELGKDEIKKVIENSGNGSVFTIISVGQETSVICEKEDDKEQAVKLLDNIELGYRVEGYGTALSKAQSYFDANKGTLTYLVTDKFFESATNIKVINVGDKSNNISLSNVEYTYSALGDLTVSGNVISYEKDETVSVQLFVDGKSRDDLILQIPVEKGKSASFNFKSYEENFEQATVKILNKDALDKDNETIIYNVKNENSYKTLLVSKTPFFIKSVLEVTGNANITVMSPSDYLKYEESQDRAITGYGFYVFHSCNPKSVPKDGSVWLINSTASIENSGFNYQEEINLEKAESLEMTKASSSFVKNILENVNGENIYVAKYSKYDTYRDFTTLFTHNGNPVIFTGLNTYGNREIVFAFDIHNSDVALMSDYVILAKNFLDFSFPTVLDETRYMCGEKALINVLSNCESIRIETPSKKVRNISTTNAVGEFALDEVGVYVVRANIGGEIREYRIYSEFPDVEKDPVTEVEGKISLNGEASGKGMDGVYDKLTLLFICLAVVIVADWVVYCYDKYQLR